MKKFNEPIMKLLRIELDLDDLDETKDININNYSVNEVYRKLLKFGDYSKFNVKITPEWIQYHKKNNTKV